MDLQMPVMAKPVKFKELAAAVEKQLAVAEPATQHGDAA
jgi:hypothetical protein